MMALETQKRSMCNLFARGKQKKTEKGTTESLAICNAFPPISSHDASKCHILT